MSRLAAHLACKPHPFAMARPPARGPAARRAQAVRPEASMARDPRDEHDATNILSGEWEPTLTW